MCHDAVRGGELVSEPRMTREELGHEAAWLHDNGLHPERVIKALGRHGSTIAKALWAVGRNDLMRFYVNRDKTGTIPDRYGDDDEL